MLKILQVRLLQYANQELPDAETRFQRCRGSRDQITNIGWIVEKAKEFQKNICAIDYAKAFDCRGLVFLVQDLRIGGPM